jgi:hypothetical protein
MVDFPPYSEAVELDEVLTLNDTFILCRSGKNRIYNSFAIKLTGRNRVSTLEHE